MDTSPPPPPPSTTATTTAPFKSFDHPKTTITPKQLPTPLTNGVLKRHKPIHRHPPPPPPAAAPVVVAYKECLKNHAAAMGGHAVDGCGEFMPSPASTPADPTSLKCAACGCHRNFHRREPDDTSPPLLAQHVIEFQPHHRHQPPPPLAAAASPADSPSPPPISSSYYPSAPHMLLALSAGTSAPPPPETTVPGGAGQNPSAKKRFRTKFTQDQKEKMQELAERVNWKMQKRDEDIILRFCSEIGVEKGVFKVWMHNNKMNKKDNCSSGGGGFDFIGTGDGRRDDAGNHNDSVSSGGNVAGNIGSSSSS